MEQYKLAINEDAQWKARKELAKLEQTALEMIFVKNWKN